MVEGGSLLSHYLIMFTNTINMEKLTHARMLTEKSKHYSKKVRLENMVKHETLK